MTFVYGHFLHRQTFPIHGGQPYMGFLRYSGDKTEDFHIVLSRISPVEHFHVDDYHRIPFRQKGYQPCFNFVQNFLRI